MHVTNPVPFSIEQLEALMRWAGQRPLGLNVTIATDYESIDEVAEVWREDPIAPRYYLVRQSSGHIEVGSIHTLPERVNDLRSGLALIEIMERASLDRQG